MCRTDSTGSRSPSRNVSRSICTTASPPRSFIARSKAGVMEWKGARRTARDTAFARMRFSPRSSRFCRKTETRIPRCDGAQRCSCGTNTTILEECYWQTLGIIRRALETRPTTMEALAEQLRAARTPSRHARTQTAQRRAAGGSSRTKKPDNANGHAPTELALKFGTKTTLRDELGRVLNYYNRATQRRALSSLRLTC